LKELYDKALAEYHKTRVEYGFSTIVFIDEVQDDCPEVRDKQWFNEDSRRTIINIAKKGRKFGLHACYFLAEKCFIEAQCYQCPTPTAYIYCKRKLWLSKKARINVDKKDFESKAKLHMLRSIAKLNGIESMTADMFALESSYEQDSHVCNCLNFDEIVF